MLGNFSQEVADIKFMADSCVELQASELLTVEEAARIVRLHPKTMALYLRRKDGPPALRLGPRCVRVSRARLFDWLNTRQTGASI